ncbi:hypothetical protein QJS83_13380 [Bdellovibrio sp. 22V]|uniref:hypothetical protein n=1 Tax=Bdellovibrio sp. 22V TaxID=3044166 RepID=UPI002543435C|nr:hypothetical protein [Bdellovibrio sp. 22V]WII71455.1 hypothetical protein QJS83_13380 [Bdellovibrio sp. 22V]
MNHSTEPKLSASGKMAISPSQQNSAQDQTGQYSIEGVVGEVTTTDQAQSHDGAYRAEVNIRFQVM